ILKHLKVLCRQLTLILKFIKYLFLCLSVTSVVNANPVTLTCDIQGGENIQWIYSLFKDGDPHDTYRTTEAEFSFTANVSDSGVYSCRGERSDISDAVTLTVSGYRACPACSATAPLIVA
uniref:Ig-like domain-containing protein n=1 Tax=Cyprinus carpio TaxID=7962 RepID=A0A8C1XYI5_CYPCA